MLAACSSDKDTATAPSDPNTGSTDQQDTFTPPPVRVPVAPEQDLSKPIHTTLHQTWDDGHTTVVVQWKTTGIDVDSHTPKVLINTRAEYEANGEVMTWSAANVRSGQGAHWKVELGGVPLDDEIYAQYEVRLTGLEPYTDYVYIAGFWDSFDTASGTFLNATTAAVGNIRTGRTKGSRAPIRFVMAGDSRGGTDGIKANIGRLAAIDADMWFFNGDMTNGGTGE